MFPSKTIRLRRHQRKTLTAVLDETSPAFRSAGVPHTDSKITPVSFDWLSDNRSPRLKHRLDTKIRMQSADDRSW